MIHQTQPSPLLSYNFLTGRYRYTDPAFVQALALRNQKHNVEERSQEQHKQQGEQQHQHQRQQQQQQLQQQQYAAQYLSYTPKFLNPKGLIVDDVVKRVCVQALWLGKSDTVAAVGSVVTKLLTSKLLAHYWIEIETISGDYYCAQFLTYALLLSKRKSSDEVAELVKSCVLNDRTNKHHKYVWKIYDSGNLLLSKSTTKFSDNDSLNTITSFDQSTTTFDDHVDPNILCMRDIINIMESFQGKYHLIHHNCQDFCKWMFQQISNSSEGIVNDPTK